MLVKQLVLFLYRDEVLQSKPSSAYLMLSLPSTVWLSRLSSSRTLQVTMSFSMISSPPC